MAPDMHARLLSGFVNGMPPEATPGICAVTVAGALWHLTCMQDC